MNRSKLWESASIVLEEGREACENRIEVRGDWSQDVEFLKRTRLRKIVVQLQRIWNHKIACESLEMYVGLLDVRRAESKMVIQRKLQQRGDVNVDVLQCRRLPANEELEFRHEEIPVAYSFVRDDEFEAFQAADSS